MNDLQGLLYRRLYKALTYSLQGFLAGLRHEEALRVEMFLAAVMIPVAVWLGEGGLEKAILILVVLLVIVVELLNSAVEAAIDRVGTDLHELSGRAKDLGSAAVLVSMLMVLIVWGLILFI
jgi:diacylglycerol kinase (ATP)